MGVWRDGHTFYNLRVEHAQDSLVHQNPGHRPDEKHGRYSTKHFDAMVAKGSLSIRRLLGKPYSKQTEREERRLGTANGKSTQ